MWLVNKLVPAASFLPSVRLTQKGSRSLCRYAREGAIRTKLGYLIHYHPGVDAAASLRRAAVAGDWEPGFFRALSRFATDVVFDVGAHEGFVSLHLARGAKRVIACEPNPENLQLLGHNIALNPNLRVSVEAAAIGSRDGEVDFHYVDGEGAWGSIAVVPSGHAKTLRVALRTLDSLWQLHCGSQEKVSLIKIDTEGNELDVLTGAERVIARNRPVLCFEVSLTYWASARGSVDDLLSFVTERDYSLWQHNDRGELRPFKWLNRRVDNLFALPGETPPPRAVGARE